MRTEGCDGDLKDLEDLVLFEYPLNNETVLVLHKSTRLIKLKNQIGLDILGYLWTLVNPCLIKARIEIDAKHIHTQETHQTLLSSWLKEQDLSVKSYRILKNT